MLFGGNIRYCNQWWAVIQYTQKIMANGGKGMNNRERTNAILHYQDYDRMPVVAFGYWVETLDKWCAEGYITKEECEGYKRYGDTSEFDFSIMKKLGFDFNWNTVFGGRNFMYPAFEEEVI